VATALVRMAFIAFVVQETLQRRKQKGAESSSVSVSRLKETPFEHFREKLLS
jgi:hypothetical protein